MRSVFKTHKKQNTDEKADEAADALCIHIFQLTSVVHFMDGVVHFFIPIVLIALVRFL